MLSRPPDTMIPELVGQKVAVITLKLFTKMFQSWMNWNKSNIPSGAQGDVIFPCWCGKIGGIPPNSFTILRRWGRGFPILCVISNSCGNWFNGTYPGTGNGIHFAYMWFLSHDHTRPIFAINVHQMVSLILLFLPFLCLYCWLLNLASHQPCQFIFPAIFLFSTGWNPKGCTFKMPLTKK